MSNLFFADDNLFDSHCHLNDHSFDADRAEVVKAATEAGVTKTIDIAIDLDCSRKAIAHAKEFPGVVFACVGIDPDTLIPGGDLFAGKLDEPASFWEAQMHELKQLALDNGEQVVAIGETGMDGHWLEKHMQSGEVDFATAKKSLQVQEQLFRMHLELASELNLPLSVHSRAAEVACLEIVQEYPAARGVFHSYTADYETAAKILDAGWALGLNGIATFKSSEPLREMYRKLVGKLNPDFTPADLYAKGIYVETDAPYLSPEGSRGERNQPASTKQIFDFLHQILT